MVSNSCSDQNQITPKQTVVDGCAVLPKFQCHEVQMGQDARLLWHMKDPEGEDVDLATCITSCSDSSSDGEVFDAAGTPGCGIELRLREITGNDPAKDKVHCVAVEVVDAATGYVRAASLPDEIVREPGVYMEEWGLFTADHRMIFSNQCCTFIRRGLFGLSSNVNKQNLGPPTLEEIRLSLRDSSRADNTLLDDVEFDAAEMAQAVVRPLQYWNEIPPPLRPAQTTKTFPFRGMWLLGIQAYLMDIAANNYRRNDLQYNAGGVAVADKAKEQAYAAAGGRLMQEFQNQVRAKKIEVNVALFSGSIGSPYGGSFY